MRNRAVEAEKNVRKGEKEREDKRKCEEREKKRIGNYSESGQGTRDYKGERCVQSQS